MGNGASSLNKADGGKLMKILKTEYEKFQKLGYGDEVIRGKLNERYQSFMASYKPSSKASEKPAPVVAKTTTTPETTSESTVATTDNKSVSKGKGKGKSGGGSRRRSFEGTPAAASSSTKKTDSTLSTSQSTTAIPTTTVSLVATDPISGEHVEKQETPEVSASSNASDTKDHWDSVSQMPYCEICKMAFKTPGLLDRHIKYSDLHARTVAKLQKDPTDTSNTSNALEDTPKEAPKEEKVTRKQKEGQDYKLLYFGSKFFWRTQDNIDFSFFHHIIPDVVEIVPFDVYKNREMNRIYLKNEICIKLFEQEMQNSRRDSTAKADKFGKGGGDKDAQARKALTSGILARLHLHDLIDSAPASTDDTKTPRRQIVYLPGPVDSDIAPISPFIDPMPPALIPVSVTHRRNTSTEEVKAKLYDLQLSQKALSKATTRAEKVVNVITDFAKNMKNDAARLQAMSKPRRRWIMAIKRVMQINGVEKTTKVLEALALKEAQKSPGSRRARAKAMP
jgi:hypothetical protein